MVDNGPTPFGRWDSAEASTWRRLFPAPAIEILPTDDGEKVVKKYWAHRTNIQGHPLDPRMEARDEAHAEELARRTGYIVRTGDYQGSLEWRSLLEPPRRRGWYYPTYLMARQGGACMDLLMRVGRLDKEGKPLAAIFGETQLAKELKDELDWRCWDIDWLREPAELGQRVTHDAEFWLEGSPVGRSSEASGLVVQCVSDATYRADGDAVADLTVVLPTLVAREDLPKGDARILEIAECAFAEINESSISGREDEDTIEIVSASDALSALIWEVNSYAGKKGVEKVVRVQGVEVQRGKIAHLIHAGMRDEAVASEVANLPESVVDELTGLGRRFVIKHRTEERLRQSQREDV